MDVERGHGRARGAEEGFCFGQGFGRGHYGGCVAEECVHVFEADVCGLGVDEPNLTKVLVGDRVRRKSREIEGKLTDNEGNGAEEGVKEV